jgi:hypothetical protein
MVVSVPNASSSRPSSSVLEKPKSAYVSVPTAVVSSGSLSAPVTPVPLSGIEAKPTSHTNWIGLLFVLGMICLLGFAFLGISQTMNDNPDRDPFCNQLGLCLSTASLW